MKSKKPTESESYEGEDPVRPMMEHLNEIIPRMEQQQKSMIKFSKSCAAAFEKFNKNLANIDSEINEAREYYENLIDIDRPPVRRMEPMFINKIPVFEVQQKLIISLLKKIGKEAVSLLDELNKINGASDRIHEK